MLEGSGWTEALIEAEVASSGVAELFLKTSHLTRTGHGHQVSLLALHNLQREAFMPCEGLKDEKSQQLWRKDMVQKSPPTFAYWDTILRYETLILFVRAHRERNFSLYMQLLEELTPLFFALDHVNYARWMPAHIRDMKSLPASVQEEFENNCHWVISKTTNSFSVIPFDQAHEQENKIVKGLGGTVGLTENPVAFKRWMLSGPQVARLVSQFQEETFSDDDLDIRKNFKHHEQGISIQNTFYKQVNSLSSTIKQTFFVSQQTNKKELFGFLTTRISNIKCPTGKSIYVTSGQSDLSVGSSFLMSNSTTRKVTPEWWCMLIYALEQ